MIPVSLLRSENCVLKSFSIDFEQPHIAQVQVVENDPEKGITFEPAPWVDYRISKDSVFEGLGEGWGDEIFMGHCFRWQNETCGI